MSIENGFFNSPLPKIISKHLREDIKRNGKISYMPFVITDAGVNSSHRHLFLHNVGSRILLVTNIGCGNSYESKEYAIKFLNEAINNYNIEYNNQIVYSNKIDL